MSEVIRKGFIRRSRSRQLTLEKVPIVTEHTDADGWYPWWYSTGKSAGVNPMLYTSRKKAQPNNGYSKPGIFEKRKYVGFEEKEGKHVPKFELIGYSEYQVEVLPAKLELL